MKEATPVVNKIPRRWRDRTANILSAYRFIGLLTAFVEVQFITAVTTINYSRISPVLLVIIVSVYTLFKVLHPVGWHQASGRGFSLLGLDIGLCAFLVIVTGGVYSPFLLYTLAPVLEAALFMDSGITVTVAGATAAYVAASHAWNPFVSIPLALPDTSQLSVYIAAVCLSAVLPYLINVNLRQSMQSEDALQERQRLSREMHDGLVQTLSALGWQMELLNRRLDEMGIDLKEAKQLEELTHKAQASTLESLEFVRSISTSGNLPKRLGYYLKQWNGDFAVSFQPGTATEQLRLEPASELELFRICQEAMTNIKKHAGAKNVTFQLARNNGSILLTITDDGMGFDAAAYTRDPGQPGNHGLDVMRERAAAIGGKFTLTSSPGHGTEVRIELPRTRE